MGGLYCYLEINIACNTRNYNDLNKNVLALTLSLTIVISYQIGVGTGYLNFYKI